MVLGVTVATMAAATDGMVRVSVEEVAAATLLSAVLEVMVVTTVAGTQVEPVATLPLIQAMVVSSLGTGAMGATGVTPVVAMVAMEVTAAVATLVMEQAMEAVLGMASPSTQSTANLLQDATSSDMGAWCSVPIVLQSCCVVFQEPSQCHEIV